MPSEAAADRHRQRHRARLAWLARPLDPDLGVGAARRADGQLTVLLAVQVQQRRSAHKGGVEPARALARAADLLVDRHQQLQRAVRQRLVLGQRHHRRDTDAVVRAERRPVGGQPVALANERDPALGGIVGAVRPTLADHVQMPLQDENRRRLPTRAGRYAHDEVAGRVLTKLEAVARPPSRECARSPAPRAATAARSWSGPRSAASTRGARPRPVPDSRSPSAVTGRVHDDDDFVPWVPTSSPR